MTTITPSELADRLLSAHRGGIEASIRRVSTALALKGERLAKQRATSAPKVRSGHLRRSIAGVVKASTAGADIVLRAGGRSGGAEVRYARIQDVGGTIVPRNRQWLTIPVHESLFTAAGVQRYASARLVPVPLFFQLGKAGIAYLRSVESGELYYVLKKSVTIEGSRYLARSADDVARAVPAAMTDALSVAMRVPR